MKKIKNIRLGILGGTFDPAHKGHLKISYEAKKLLNLSEVIWVITKKNPLKKKSFYSLNSRMKFAKKLVLKKKYIKVKFVENKINSNKKIDLIKFFKKNNKFKDLYFLMGADSLINFHKWYKWSKILENCKIIVFDRQSYKSRSLKSVAFKKYGNKGINFITFKKVNISSSKLRKIW